MTRRTKPSDAERQHALDVIWQCFELRDDLRAAREHLVGGIARLVGAHAVMEGTGRRTLTDGEQLGEPVLHGPKIVGTQLRAYHDSGLLWSDPFRRRAMNKRNWTGARRELLADRDWYMCLGFRYREAAGVDDEIKSVIAIDSSGAFSLMTLQRSAEERSFNAQEVGLVQFLHETAVGILKRPTPALIPMPVLTPVLKATLQLAMTGKSDQEIAHKLCRSVRTVSENMARLFRQFDVRNRQELLAFFIDRHVTGASPRSDA